jgi:Alginate export
MFEMKHLRLPLVLHIGVALSLLSAAARADALEDFIGQGHVIVDTRLRYENVDQAGFSRDAGAATIRERLGFETAQFDSFKALLEVQATQHLSGAFNDSINGRIGYPQVPDPENFDLNRLQLSYSGVPGATAVLGRQVINLDDQRFIGASAFRQNEQTFDAARLDYGGIAGLAATYIYIDRVNRVFGERSPVGHFNGNVHVFHAAYDIADIGKLTGYAYLLDLDRNPALSTATYGAQLAGARPLDDTLSLHYLVGYARQTGYAANPRDLALDYWRVEGGPEYAGWSIIGGMESLGGDGKSGFQTPLATLHAFQGYADAFLTTPPRGVADRYGKLAYQTDLQFLGGQRRVTFAAWYHDFSAVQGSGSEGHETDLEAAVRLSEHWRLDLVYAAYEGAASIASRHKTWLSLTTNF